MSISALKATLGPGARSSKFKITFHNMFTKDLSVIVKSSSFPTKSLSTIDVNYLGRTISMPGDVEYERTWDVVFYETELHLVRELFTSVIDRYDFNSGATNVDIKDNSFSAVVEQLNQHGESVKSYTFFNIWPKSVSQTDLSADSQDSIQEQTVTLSYDYWE